MAILKHCSHRGCYEVLQQDIQYCEYHSKKHIAKQKERYKEYQHRRLQDYNEVRSQSFYQSTEWDRLREVVKASLFHIDIFEYYRTGKIVEGETVHHILEVREEWEARFDVNNLIYLTQRNHLLIHKKYKESKEAKARVQRILLGLIEQFNKEFCV